MENKDINEEIIDDINEEQEIEKQEENETSEETIEVEEKDEAQDDGFKDKYLRLLADFENQKRRSSIEILNQSQMTKVEVFRELVDVIDNFERAMTFEASTKEFKEGIELVHEQMVNKLEKLGLELVATDGQMDHNLHQAVMTDTVDGYEDDEILETLQKGYKLEDKLIRAAMVKVNKK